MLGSRLDCDGSKAGLELLSRSPKSDEDLRLDRERFKMQSGQRDASGSGRAVWESLEASKPRSHSWANLRRLSTLGLLS